MEHLPVDTAGDLRAVEAVFMALQSMFVLRNAPF
jgi:hypothetical protein